MSFVFGGLFVRRESKQTAKIANELWIIGIQEGIEDIFQEPTKIGFPKGKPFCRICRLWLPLAVLLIKFMINE